METLVKQRSLTLAKLCREGEKERNKQIQMIRRIMTGSNSQGDESDLYTDLQQETEDEDLAVGFNICHGQLADVC